jgi:hypothetical protein
MGWAEEDTRALFHLALANDEATDVHPSRTITTQMELI